MLARFLFENSPWSPFWTAWSVGYCVVEMDGQVYLTEAGQEYLDGAGTCTEMLNGVA